MSAYVADPDFAHAVELNPAKLSYAGYLYVSSDYEYESRSLGELFLPPSSEYFSNGNFVSWNASLGMPAGPIGVGAAFSAYDIGGWRTTSSSLGLAVPLPLGFSVGVAPKYLTVEKLMAIPGGDRVETLKAFAFDVGAMNRTVLANTTFFRAILSTGAVFTNILPKQSWDLTVGVPAPLNPNVTLPRSLGLGIAYTFASNYRLADFELFRVTGALDYTHVFTGDPPLDGLREQPDQYRIGLETMALGVLALRIGYTLKSPSTPMTYAPDGPWVSQPGSGFSYGFSLRFPVKLVLPALPVTSLELSYAKNPEWSSGMYHDLFGAVAEILF